MLALNRETLRVAFRIFRDKGCGGQKGAEVLHIIATCHDRCNLSPEFHKRK